MEITLETIYQQLVDTRAEMKADKAEMKAEVGRLESKVDSVKTWFISLSLSTILVVTAIMTAVVTAQLN